ncbi:MAG TPA: tryptophan synthase subunit alpha [Euzebyales bacterium]|nr:tryptophan synthase subunit alpha [Euzebyales bacterium]
MSRVSEAIRTANADGRAALVVYLPAGFPDMATSQACLEAAADSGADLLEIGFPYSDPLMDGPVIQRANQVALDAGYTPHDDFAMCRQLNDRVDIPTLVMTYYNILWHYQAPDRLRGFAADAAAAGLAGAIVPDLPVHEGDDWLAVAADAGLATVFLVASTSSDDHLAAAARASDGFIYATSTLGVTGTRESLSERAGPLVSRLRGLTSQPVCVGIGVSTAAHAEAVAGFADGVIVGSAAVRAAADGGPAAVADLVSDLAAGCRRGYPSAVRVADSTR